VPFNHPRKFRYDIALPLVVFADLTLWTKTIPKDEFRELSVEIRLDQKVEKGTKLVKHNKLQTWNEEFPMCV